MILPATDETYRRAARILAKGELVALPTETVYGLAGDAMNAASISKIYALKGRPASNPLITHVTNPGQAGDFGVMNEVAQTLAGRFWPGPLTLVVERKPSALAAGADAGFATIALRCPDVGWAGLIEGPLVMPSANRSTYVSPTDAAHVAADFGEDLLIIDGGTCPGGLESTVVRAFDQGVQILRPGAITADEIAACAPLLEGEAVGEAQGSPGLMARHYSPRTPVRLNAQATGAAGEFHIGFGDQGGTVNLSESGDLGEAARGLYAALRQADSAPDMSVITVAPIPNEGLGVAINDRLRRAAHQGRATHTRPAR